MTRLTLLTCVPLLLLAGCSRDAGAARELGAALTGAASQAIATGPDLQYRLVAFDGQTSTLELTLQGAPGTADNIIDVDSITLDGKVPVTSLPVRLGPVPAGQQAAVRLGFAGVKWQDDDWSELAPGQPASFAAPFTYRIQTSHRRAGGGADSSTSSTANLSVPLRVAPDAAIHAELTRRLRAGR